MNVYLIGYRGTGKSTIAPLVARRLGKDWSWIDMDARIEADAGQSIAEIFASAGEPSFRDRENQVLEKLSLGDRQVIATGGGVVLRAENRAVLARGHVAWLTGQPHTLWNRLQKDATTLSRRPDLTPGGGYEEIERMLTVREPLYRSCAHQTLATDEASADELSACIADAVKSRLARGGD